MDIQLLQESIRVRSVTLTSPNTQVCRDTSVVLPDVEQKYQENTGKTAKPGSHWLTE